MSATWLTQRGMSERTQEAYVRAVRQLAQHFQKSPDLVSEEELRQYFLHRKNVKKYARPTPTIALCGIKFFFEKTLGKQWSTFELIRPPREKKLPTILSTEEVRRGSKVSWLPLSCALRMNGFARSKRPGAERQSRKCTASATRRCRTETRCLARRSDRAAHRRKTRL